MVSYVFDPLQNCQSKIHPSILLDFNSLFFIDKEKNRHKLNIKRS